MKLTFLGATQTVTGSKYLLEQDNQRILIDCGLFQGLKELRLRNWSPLPINPASIDAVVLTHAHIDHSGYLPLLIKQGFKGQVYATRATCDLCRILLPDSGHLHEEDAKRANRYGYSKHHPALPLYTRADAEIALKQFRPVDYRKPYAILREGSVTWFPAGHILGSSFIQFDIDGKKLLFSGDIGRLHNDVMKPPAVMQAADYLVLESTYGDRLHDRSNPEDDIAVLVNETAKRGGTVLIAAFSVGRAQSILYYLHQLKTAGRIPPLPIYLDSPMAVSATEILLRYPDEHTLRADECRDVCHTAQYINSPDESKALDQMPMPKIIISASGMMTGGRILHHLKRFAVESHHTILLTGFQAAGTRGARLLAGERELKIHGSLIPVKAQIANLTNTSAHADYEEIMTWLRQFNHPPRKVFITHGEPHAAASLKNKIESELNWPCQIPAYLDAIEF